jgi:hypothetical protein
VGLPLLAAPALGNRRKDGVEAAKPMVVLLLVGEVRWAGGVIYRRKRDDPAVLRVSAKDGTF